jgi:hypothetical protein
MVTKVKLINRYHRVANKALCLCHQMPPIKHKPPIGNVRSGVLFCADVGQNPLSNTSLHRPTGLASLFSVWMPGVMSGDFSTPKPVRSAVRVGGERPQKSNRRLQHAGPVSYGRSDSPDSL